MGPPRSKNIAALQSRSRFAEGSMNDRTSARPPVHFLGPEAREALEQPALLHRGSTEESAPQNTQPNRLSGSKLLGQVWDGLFRGKLRLRKDNDESDRSAASSSTGHYVTRSKTAQNTASNTAAPAASDNNFASRDEVLANYQQLVADGFFKAKAIHSTRQPGPPPSAPAPNPPAAAHARRPSASHTAPQWPLAPLTASATTPAPAHTRSNSPIRSPASASSRGTKRAAADDSDSDDSNPHDADKENVAPPPPQQQQQLQQTQTTTKKTQPKKRLRTIASRDGIFMPKLRSVASRRNLGGSRRSISASASTSGVRESNKLSKRPPATATQGMFDMPLNYQPRQHNLRPTLRNVSDGGGGECRVLRSRRSMEGRAAPLSVVPDANRGIPSVPAIPPKFTYGEDRETGAPWRGLRIR